MHLPAILPFVDIFFRKDGAFCLSKLPSLFIISSPWALLGYSQSKPFSPSATSQIPVLGTASSFSIQPLLF